MYGGFSERKMIHISLLYTTTTYNATEIILQFDYCLRLTLNKLLSLFQYKLKLVHFFSRDLNASSEMFFFLILKHNVIIEK